MLGIQLVRQLCPTFVSGTPICPVFTVFSGKAGGLARRGPISEQKYLELTLLNKNCRGKGIRKKRLEGWTHAFRKKSVFPIGAGCVKGSQVVRALRQIHTVSRHHFLAEIGKLNLCLFDVNLLMRQIHCKKLLYGFCKQGNMQEMEKLKGGDFGRIGSRGGG